MTDIQITDQDEQTLFELFDAQSLDDLDSKVTAWLTEAKTVKQQIEINALKLELQRAKQTPSIRDFCESIINDYRNNYLTVNAMAGHQGIKTDTMNRFLNMCHFIVNEDF